MSSGLKSYPTTVSVSFENAPLKGLQLPSQPWKVQVAQLAFDMIKRTLSQEARNGVLIHCWGGVNRSTATLVAFLVTEFLGEAVEGSTSQNWLKEHPFLTIDNFPTCG